MIVSVDPLEERLWLREHESVDTSEDSDDWGEVGKHDRTLCFAKIGSGPRRGESCTRDAGSGTLHLGVGNCSMHGGNSEEGRRTGAWVMAHAFARALDCTPWEGLLTAVKIAAGRVAFCEHKLAQAEVDRQLEPPDKNGISEASRTEDQQGTNLFFWVKQAELWHDKLAKVSALAIQQGVAERLVRQLETEARIMLQATHRTLEELGFSDEEKQRAVVIMSRNLLALEAEEVGLSVKETE
jgi:hypothetical protein